jgi:septal ring factor EnvC (AmiA/AmiB activator)
MNAMKTILLKLQTPINSRRWNVSEKVYRFTLLFSILLCWNVGVHAQESAQRMTKAEKANQSNRATDTAADFSSSNHELKEVEVKINKLLTEVRNQLAIDSNKEWFSQNLEKSLRQKSEQVCPNIPVLTLMFGNESFVCTPKMDKQELLYIIDFLNVSINGMLTK